MLTTLPQSITWSELNRSKRGLALVEEIYGDIPRIHLEQIRRINTDSMLDMNRWLDKLLPSAVSADQLGFPESKFLKLQESMWNTDDDFRYPDLHHGGPGPSKEERERIRLLCQERVREFARRLNTRLNESADTNESCSDSVL